MRADRRHLVSRVTAAWVIMLATGCTASGQPADRITNSPQADVSPSADLVAALRRPWAQPQLPAGEPCPVTQVVSMPDPALAGLWGTGPARPALLGNGVLDYVSPDQTVWVDRSWGGRKVLWAVDPAERGVVLIRGRQLDGPGLLAFEDPAIPELVLIPGEYEGLPGGWRDYPSYTRLRTPGCYAYQIDTAEGTWTVVFIARGPRLSALSTAGETDARAASEIWPS